MFNPKVFFPSRTARQLSIAVGLPSPKPLKLSPDGAIFALARQNLEEAGGWFRVRRN
jgi:hypothetical protein